MNPKQYLIFLIVLLVSCTQSPDSQTTRQAEVAERGREVMPFDLERTTHIFKPLPTGGLQQVISDDDDHEQIALIRTHLLKEVERFQAGDFHDPAMIHGNEMPGLHTLMTRADEITMTYQELPDGGEILYTSKDEAIIEALHLWFEAQLSDHGHHATDGS